MAPPASVRPGMDEQAFRERLKPTLLGLPGLQVALLAVGTFILVLLLMWILLG